jgi:hypothetical protein
MRIAILAILAVLPLFTCDAVDRQIANFASKSGLKIVRDRTLKVVRFKSPEEMNRRLVLPLYENGGLCVARCDLDGGVIYLGRDNDSDLRYETFKYHCWPDNWRTDERRWRALAEKYASK